MSWAAWDYENADAGGSESKRTLLRRYFSDDAANLPEDLPKGLLAAAGEVISTAVSVVEQTQML